jgi:hypothetical protein
MRKIIRFTFALICGFIAFEAVELWPVRPMWTLKEGPLSRIRIIGFSSDHSALLVQEDLETGDGKYSVNIREINVDTGAEQSQCSVLVEEEDGWRFTLSEPIPVGRYLFADYVHLSQSNSHLDDRALHRYKILDPKHGKTLYGPFRYEGWGDVDFSTTAKWFVAPVLNSSRGKDIISTFTGNVVLRLRDDKKVHSYFFRECFAPDDSAIAIQSLKDTGQYFIEIYDLPSGALRFAHALSDELVGCQIEKWDRDGLHLLKSTHYQDTENSEVYSYSFQVQEKGFGELKKDTGLYGRSVETEEWKTHMTRLEFGNRVVQKSEMRFKGKQDWLDDLKAWINEKFGTDINSSIFATELSFVDRTSGKSLYWLKFSSPEDDIKAEISKDGRRVARVQDEKEKKIVMWDAAPFPRWPWAIGIAFLTFLFVYFLPFLRKHAAQQKLQPSGMFGLP